MRMFWSCKLAKLFFFNDVFLVRLTPQQSSAASQLPAGIDCGDPQCYSLQEPNSYNFEILPRSFGNKRGEIVVHSIDSRIFNRTKLWRGWVTCRILCDQIQGTGLCYRRWLSWSGLINCAPSEVPQDAATALFSGKLSQSPSSLLNVRSMFLYQCLVLLNLLFLLGFS
jgi:hypothetical protein